MRAAIVQHPPAYLNSNVSVAKAVDLIADARRIRQGHPYRRQCVIAPDTGYAAGILTAELDLALVTEGYLAMNAKGHVSDVPVQDRR